MGNFGKKIDNRCEDYRILFGFLNYACTAKNIRVGKWSNLLIGSCTYIALVLLNSVKSCSSF